MKNNIKALLITLVIANILFYLWLPPLNITAIEFWVFLFFNYYIFYVIKNFTDLFTKNGKSLIGKNIILFALPFGIAALIFIVNFILSPVFNSKSYANRITIDETADFTKDIKEVDFKTIPLIDKDSSQKLGDRVMGQMPELVSQFYVSDLYTQINYKDEIIRVTPLEYSNFFKYLANHKDGVKGYIKVNSVTGAAELVKLDKGIKYTESGYFSEYLYRHIRYHYPTAILGDANFEIDNEDNPYWIVPVLKYSGVSIKEEVKSVLIVNAITGEIKKYDLDQVPTWVDHVYSASLIIEEVDDWGKYRMGFMNTLFSQKNVVATTTGYNYMALNDDVYLYTGITSVSTDEANIGFILTNMRTKETKFYSVPGAEEYSAMASAEGQVQQMNYVSTFPLLINLDDRATYLVSLKDNAGLVKMYAFVDVNDYQKVTVTDASLGIETAAKNYLEANFKNVHDSKLVSSKIKIKDFNVIDIDGNTYYYLLDGEGSKYKIAVKTNEELVPFIKIDDTYNIWYREKKNLTEIVKITK